jgi:D-3-phosphoglycerate dehydrogenase
MTCSKSFYNAYCNIEEEMAAIGVDFTKVLSEKPIPMHELVKHVNDIDIYLVAVEKVDRTVIDAAPKLKYILKHGVGVDNIDVAYAKEKGILVTNAPGQNSDAVADMTMALMLAASRFVTKGDAIVKNNGWELLIGHELKNKVLGIMGLGAIGKEVAKRAKGFGMKILAYDVFQNLQYAREYNIQYVTKEELLSKADFVSVCMALNDDTKHSINRDFFKMMKPTAYLINTSRGPIVNEKDLIWALENDVISGAAIDVYESEPPDKTLVNAKNIITTPHIAGSTFECAERLSKIAVSNIAKFIAGSRPDFIVK